MKYKKYMACEPDEIPQEKIELLKKLNILKMDNTSKIIFNQKLVLNLETSDDFKDALIFFKELYKKYPILKNTTPRNIVTYYLRLDDLNTAKCLVPECQNTRVYSSETKKVRYCCEEHKKHPIIKEVSREVRAYKIKKTNLEKYGVENVSQLEKVKNKKEETTLKNYGVVTPLQSNVIKDRIKKTNLEKYGVENPRQVPEFVEKARQNSIKKHGYTHYMKNPELRENYYKKIYEEKGYYFPNQKNTKNVHNLNKEFIEKTFIDENNQFMRTECLEYFGFGLTSGIYDTLRKFNIEYTSRKGTSHAEVEIFNFIKELVPNTTIIKNSRKIIPPYELDIYLPEYNFAIEYNGSYWHSVGLEDYNTDKSMEKVLQNKRRHIQKVKLCEEKNINLMHIYEFDFKEIQKKEIIFSMIKNRLNKCKKIYARKTQIKEVSLNESIEFINSNHIQGNSPSSIKYGLYYNDELVSIMTFGKSRFDKNYDFELIRFCNKKNTSVIGGASKLLNHFIKHNPHNSIVSYGNRNFLNSKKNMYLTLGFEYIRENISNEIYLKNSVAYTRYQLNKKQTKKIFAKNNIKYDNTKSCDFNLLNNGFRILYGPGTITYCYNGK